MSTVVAVVVSLVRLSSTSGSLPTTDGAGLQSNIVYLQQFIGIMLLYPDVQKRAQQELDSVLGSGRLPSLEECVHFLLT